MLNCVFKIVEIFTMYNSVLHTIVLYYRLLVKKLF